MSASAPSNRDNERCPCCSYCLRGLDTSGKCPECGHDLTKPGSRHQRGASAVRKLGLVLLGSSVLGLASLALLALVLEREEFGWYPLPLTVFLSHIAIAWFCIKWFVRFMLWLDRRYGGAPPGRDVL